MTIKGHFRRESITSKLSPDHRSTSGRLGSFFVVASGGLLATGSW